jgi:hypothetical protein
MAGDLVRLKESIERIAELAGVFPGWRNTLAMAQSHYRRLQGDGAGALEAILPALDNSAPGQDPDWPWVVAAHVHALVACGRHAEAARLGWEYYATTLRERLVPPNRCLIQPLCAAYLGNGQRQEALELMDSTIAELEAKGVQGLWLGGFYESRAYVAVAMGDQAAFEKYAELCAAEFRRGKNSTLVANYERLVETAHRSSLGVSASLQRAAEPPEDPPSSRLGATTAQSVLSRLNGCLNRAERAECALSAICEETGAVMGHLFGIRSRGVEYLASFPRDLALPPDLAPSLERYLADCTNEGVTESIAGRSEALSTTSALSRARASLQPGLVLRSRGGELSVSAVTALRYEAPPVPLSREVMNAVSEALVLNDDVEPIRWGGS